MLALFRCSKARVRPTAWLAGNDFLSRTLLPTSPEGLLDGLGLVVCIRNQPLAWTTFLPIPKNWDPISVL